MTFRNPIEWESTLPIRPSSPAWVATIKALYGTPLDEAELDLFRLLSGGLEPGPAGYTEALAVVGRRGGKSESIARVATFEAVHVGHEVALAPGQRGLVVVISPLRDQSQEILNYAKGLAGLAEVKPYVDSITRDEVSFTNGIAIKVLTADAVAVSGPTVVCAIRDELAKFPGDDSACPDFEIDASLRPALAPVVGAPPRRLIGITSAYLQSGIAYETDRDHYGQPGPVLVLRGDTTTFNPNIDRDWLARERTRVGASVFLREYGTPETGPVWQAAITDGWFGDVVDRSIDKGIKQRSPKKHVHYCIAIDP